MIFFYADLRVAPYGVNPVVPLMERLLEFQKRHKLQKMPQKADDSKEFITFAKRVEKELFTHEKIKPEEITNESVQKYYKKY